MRSQQTPVLGVGALRGLGFSRRHITDVERAVAPHGVHDHRQLARHRDTGLAMTGALGELLAPALDLVPAAEARHQRRRCLVQRAPHIGVASFGDASLNVDRRARLPAPRRQPEVGRDVTRPAEARRIVDRCHERERRHRADAGDHHEASAELAACHDPHDDIVQSAALFPQRRAPSAWLPSARPTADRPPPRRAPPDRTPLVRPCLGRCRATTASGGWRSLDQESWPSVCTGGQEKLRPVAALRLDVGLAEPASACWMQMRKMVDGHVAGEGFPFHRLCLAVGLAGKASSQATGSTSNGAAFVKPSKSADIKRSTN